MRYYTVVMCVNMARVKELIREKKLQPGWHGTIASREVWRRQALNIQVRHYVSVFQDNYALQKLRVHDIEEDYTVTEGNERIQNYADRVSDELLQQRDRTPKFIDNENA